MSLNVPINTLKGNLIPNRKLTGKKLCDHQFCGHFLMILEAVDNADEEEDVCQSPVLSYANFANTSANAKIIIGGIAMAIFLTLVTIA